MAQTAVPHAWRNGIDRINFELNSKDLDITGLHSKWNRPLDSLPTPIVFNVSRCWIKHISARKMRQQDMFLVSLLVDIKLNEKDGTQRTLLR
jgi:hypothetical protein